MVPDRADTWTRMVYAGPNKPIAPIDDPYQMFAKLYGRMKDQETLEERARRPAGRPAKGRRRRQRRRSPLLDEHATFVREMEQELDEPPEAQTSATPCPQLEPGVKHDNDNMPKISKMQIDLMVNSFAADFARVATLAVHQLGRRTPRCAGSASTKAITSCRTNPTAISKAQEKLTKINNWYLRAAGLPGQAAGRNARAGRRRQPARQHADRLDQRAGQGQFAHARQHPVRAGRQRPRLQDGPLAQVQESAPQPAAAVAGPRLGPSHRQVRQPEFLREWAAEFELEDL